PAAGDQFGKGLGAGDGKIVVGAPFDDTGATDSGSVYAYDTSGNLLVTSPNFSNQSSNKLQDQFGWSVSVGGGFIIVGAPLDDSSTGTTLDMGRAYVFSGSTFLPLWTLSDSAPAAGDQFGYAVSVTVGGKVLVGTPFDDPGGTLDAGRVFVFEGATGAQLASRPAATPFGLQHFGAVLSPAGNDAAVGDPFSPGGGAVTLLDVGARKIYTPAANYFGRDTSQSTAFDGQNSSAAATVSLTVTSVPDAPVALDDFYSTTEDQQLNLTSDAAVLRNDSDADPGT